MLQACCRPFVAPSWRLPYLILVIQCNEREVLDDVEGLSSLLAHGDVIPNGSKAQPKRVQRRWRKALHEPLANWS